VRARIERPGAGRQSFDGHETLREDIGELDEQAEGCDARDEPFVLPSDSPTQEAEDLPL
jgi:hypothetical protein